MLIDDNLKLLPNDLFQKLIKCQNTKFCVKLNCNIYFKFFLFSEKDEYNHEIHHLQDETQ